MAHILAHPRYTPKLVPVMIIEDQTPESIERAKEANRLERICAIAAILAGFDGLTFATAAKQLREHYMLAAGLAIDAAARLELSL